AASRPRAPRNSSTCTTAAAATASRMARGWASPSRASWRAAWAVTSVRTAQGPAGVRCSASRCCWRRSRRSRWARKERRMAERIAIVEDERLVRELVAVNLRHAGYEIVTAEDFERGRELLARREYQLAILDLMLPGGD